jgi:hypothetical protein
MHKSPCPRKQPYVRAAIVRTSISHPSALTLVTLAVLSVPLWAPQSIQSQIKPTNKPPEPQLTCDSVSSSHPSKKHSADRPLAEEFTGYYLLSGGMGGWAPLVSVDVPGGRMLAPQYMGVPERVSVKKDASAFRVNAQDNISFTLTTFDTLYAAAPIRLFRFEIVKSKREFTDGQWAQCTGGGDSGIQLSCKDYTRDPGLPISVWQLGESSRRITPSSPLQPGEYAVQVGRLVFTFGVDSPAK